MRRHADIGLADRLTGRYGGLARTLGLIHRDIKPANIMQCEQATGRPSRNDAGSGDPSRWRSLAEQTTTFKRMLACHGLADDFRCALFL